MFPVGVQLFVFLLHVSFFIATTELRHKHEVSDFVKFVETYLKHATDRYHIYVSLIFGGLLWYFMHPDMM